MVLIKVYIYDKLFDVNINSHIWLVHYPKITNDHIGSHGDLMILMLKILLTAMMMMVVTIVLIMQRLVLLLRLLLLMSTGKNGSSFSLTEPNPAYKFSDGINPRPSRPTRRDYPLHAPPTSDTGLAISPRLLIAPEGTGN